MMRLGRSRRCALRIPELTILRTSTLLSILSAVLTAVTRSSARHHHSDAVRKVRNSSPCGPKRWTNSLASVRPVFRVLHLTNDGRLDTGPSFEGATEGGRIGVAEARSGFSDRHAAPKQAQRLPSPELTDDTRVARPFVLESAVQGLAAYAEPRCDGFCRRERLLPFAYNQCRHGRARAVIDG